MDMPLILQKAVELALEGHPAMIKLLLELTISKPQAQEDPSDGKEKVRVTIRNLTLKNDPLPIEAKVINSNVVIE